jgi:hypothetical protein
MEAEERFMLTREEVIVLYRKHRHEKVLSVYLNAEEHDPAKRRAWRRSLDHVLADVQRQLQDDAVEREAFEKALGHVKKELRQYDAFLPDRGWAGFATPATLLYAETLPVVMPDLARWEDGLRVAPYVRALKQATPVITVLIDSRQARVFRYRQGEFEQIADVQADTFFGDLSDVNMSKRATTHTGVRGMTDTDAARRFEQVGAERLLKHLTELVREAATSDGTVVVGGTNEMSAALMQRLPRTMNGRLHEDASLSFYLSLPELKKATEAAASVVRAGLQERLVDQVIELTRAGSRGCLDRQATERALLERRVEVLLLSRRLSEEEPEYADRCVGTAFEQDAEVDEVKGDAAQRLDHEGGGIGARLRFT